MFHSPAFPWAPVSCPHPLFAPSGRRLGYRRNQIPLVLFQIGRQTVNAFDDPSTPYREHFLEEAFGAFGGAAAQVAFTAFGAHQHPRPRQAKAFRSSFVGFEFVFSFRQFSRHSLSPFTESTALRSGRGQIIIVIDLSGYLSARDGFFFLFLLLRLFTRRQDHQHRASFQSRSLLDDGNVG